MAASQLTSRQYAYVCVSGPGQHEAITDALGMRPSEAWNVGDTNPQHGRPRKHMTWKLHSGFDDSQPLERHIESLLIMLRPRAQALRGLWVDNDLVLQCVGYYPANSGPGIHFDRETVRQAASLGLAIDCDLYFFHEEDAGG